jgi:predicted phosphoadenosine phosphosulfate sulfurtransferase
VSLRVFVRSEYWFVNAFSRSQPFYKAFDPAAKDRWLRQPFPNAEDAVYRDLANIVDIETYPWNWETTDMIKVVGLRAQESPRRRLAINSSKGHLTQPDPVTQVISCRPIYDWSDGDVWLAIKKHGWDYNRAYDELYKANVPRKEIRIAPPVLGSQSLHVLSAARKIWPDWFERLCGRLEGVRRVATYGKRALMPERRCRETWKQCFERLCLKAPIPWIADRARQAMDAALKIHARHSSLPLPEVTPCFLCSGDKTLGSWKRLTHALYNGDPICMKTASLGLKPVNPEKLMAKDPSR